MIVEPIIVAALAGGAAAQLAGPLSLGWPGRAGELVARIAALASRRPSRRAKAIGAAVIGVVLVGGGLAAYAAMPAAPRRIIVRAAQAAGLGVRDAFLGDRVSPTLAPVSVEQATLDPTATDHARRAEEDARELKEQVPKYWDGATPLPGLTLAETQRFYILSGRESNAAEAAVADIGARARAAGISGYSVAFGLNDTSSLLGPDALEFALLVQKREDARQQAAAETYDRYGPVLVHLPAPYVDANAQAAMAPYPGALWARTVRPEDGGIDMVITAHPGPTRPLSLEIAANPPPLAVRITRRVNGQDSTDPVAIPTWTELAQKE